MGVRFPSVTTTTFVGPLPANATETVILTTPPISPPFDNTQLLIMWGANITEGAGTTFLSFRLRRGTTTAAPLVTAADWTGPAQTAVRETVSGCYVDSPGAVGGVQYSLTVIQNAATGAGTFQDGCLTVFAL